jgi:hypothetical protein
MFNVPRTPAKQRGDDKVQNVDTVMERLEVVSCILHLTIHRRRRRHVDLQMGFHEATYPAMRAVVESHLPADGSNATKDEDDVMSEILEKLLEVSGSGSGMQPTGSSK